MPSTWAVICCADAWTATAACVTWALSTSYRLIANPPPGAGRPSPSTDGPGPSWRRDEVGTIRPEPVLVVHRGHRTPRPSTDRPREDRRRARLALVGDPWNINIHYDGLLDRLVPPHARRVCDVGCGDGFLAARLARRVPEVLAVDVDAPVLARAQRRFPQAPVRWLAADVMDAPLERASFDAVVSNATLHHLDDTPAALSRLASLLA